VREEKGIYFRLCCLVAMGSLDRYEFGLRAGLIIIISSSSSSSSTLKRLILILYDALFLVRMLASTCR